MLMIVREYYFISIKSIKNWKYANILCMIFKCKAVQSRFEDSLNNTRQIKRLKRFQSKERLTSMGDTIA